MNYENEIAAIEQFMEAHPREALSVFRNIVSCLRLGDLEWAQKLMRDEADKFDDRSRAYRLFDSLGLLDPEHRAFLVRWGYLQCTAMGK